MPKGKKKTETKDMYSISSSRPVPPNKRETSSKLTETMSLMKSGDSFDMPVTAWYALKAKLGAHPGTYTYRKDKAAGTFTVWKR